MPESIVTVGGLFVLIGLVFLWQPFGQFLEWAGLRAPLMTSGMVVSAIAFAVILSAAATWWIQYRHGETATKWPFQDDWSKSQFTSVLNRRFENIHVVLDGKSFRRCTFRNVVLVWKGEKAFQLEDNHFDVPSGVLTFKMPRKLMISVNLGELFQREIVAKGTRIQVIELHEAEAR